MHVKRDDLQLCIDCVFAAVNGDYSGLDRNYDKKTATLRKQEIEGGLELLGGNLVPNFDSQDGIDNFSSAPCDCCGSTLSGTRYRFSLLAD